MATAKRRLASLTDASTTASSPQKVDDSQPATSPFIRGFLPPLTCLAIPKAIKRIPPPRGVPKTRAPRRRDNPQKAQYRHYSDAERAEWEHKARLQNLAYKSEAVEALCAVLRSLGIDHRREEKVVAFGNTYFIDVWCPVLHIAWECDGAHHRNTRPRDRGRDEDISRALNCRVIRRWNRWYLEANLRDRILYLVAEGEQHAFS